MSSTLIRKITPATVCGDLLKGPDGNFRRLDVPGAPDEIPLYDVYGIVAGVKQSKPGSEREWIGFKGEFEAVRCDTGQVFNSGVVFVHPPLTDMIFGRLMKAKEEDENATVQFAIRTVLVKPTPGKVSATGYEFRVVSLMEANEVSPLRALREAAKAELLKLAAPTSAPAIDAQAPAKSKK